LKTKKRKRKERETLNEIVRNTNYGLKGNVIEPKQCRLEGGRQPLLLPYDTRMFFLIYFASFFLYFYGYLGDHFLSLTRALMTKRHTILFLALVHHFQPKTHFIASMWW